MWYIPYVKKIVTGIMAMLFLFLLVGCGESDEQTIDAKKAEKKIKTGIISQTGVNIDVVTCPNAKLKKGNVFTCTAQGKDGTSAPVAVKQTDGKGHVSYKVRLVASRSVEASIRDTVNKKTKGQVASVKCPTVVQLVAKKKFLCEITSIKGQKAHATVTLQDNKGHFGFTVGR